ncbi:hypothetical protein CDL15_Pgr020965 [Punica granatum]|uniref:Uncharacterized protein n=1 Tax=Punica granatum TaxID=22663 RepID=A0A218Y0S7_PUNGR|nr:hypothetical protein CDL15_Pgr020965 [Punica granatum]PKI69572.1 hypothetical protein CRG98_010020 [Punica granatum]
MAQKSSTLWRESKQFERGSKSDRPMGNWTAVMMQSWNRKHVIASPDTTLSVKPAKVRCLRCYSLVLSSSDCPSEGVGSAAPVPPCAELRWPMMGLYAHKAIRGRGRGTGQTQRTMATWP